MPDSPVSITSVRVLTKDAGPLLDAFVNGGTDAGNRPPRGIDPEYVSYWIRTRVKPDASPISMRHLGDLLRFYERADILDHVSRFLTRNEADERSFRRALYILQIIGEVGTPEQTAFAVRYMNEFLLPRPLAMDFFPLVLETAEALAIAVDMSLIGRRLQAAIDAAGVPENVDSPAAIPYLKYNDYRVLEYPNATRVVEAKRRLAAASPAQRLPELLFLYLGESPLSSPSMTTWAGRLIRRHAMEDAATAKTVTAAFAQIIDGAAKSQMPQRKKDFLIHRAGQAILYCRGSLSFPQEAAFRAVQQPTENFLWDDTN